MTATIADTIYQTLSQRIVAGEMEAGEKLRQDHIARDFNTSHVPVREALLRLEAHGLAQSQPRRGMRVTELNPGEIREIVEMRVALEILALQNAVGRMTPSAIRPAFFNHRARREERDARRIEASSIRPLCGPFLPQGSSGSTEVRTHHSSASAWLPCFSTRWKPSRRSSDARSHLAIGTDL